MKRRVFPLFILQNRWWMFGKTPWLTCFLFWKISTDSISYTVIRPFMVFYFSLSDSWSYIFLEITSHIFPFIIIKCSWYFNLYSICNNIPIFVSNILCVCFLSWAILSKISQLLLKDTVCKWYLLCFPSLLNILFNHSLILLPLFFS